MIENIGADRFSVWKRIREAIFAQTALATKIPERVYHYTTVGGLHGIITRNQLWATHAGFMNDSREIDFAIQMILSKIDAMLRESDDESFRDFLSVPRQFFGGKDFTGAFSDVYVLCFTKKRDNLDFWQSYAGKGQGVCLEFETAGMSDFIEYNGLFRACVIYDERLQIGSVDRILRQSYEEMRKGNLNPLEARIICRTLLIDCVPLFKHPAFSEEKEIRFVLPNAHIQGSMDSMVKFRDRGKLLVPYIPIQPGLPQKKITALKKIILGPAANAELVSKSIEILLRVQGYPQMIEFSEIPYRGN